MDFWKLPFMQCVIHSSKGAFTLGSIAWSKPEFNCSPLPPLDCVPIILFGSEPRFVCVIKPAAVPCCIKCIRLLSALLYIYVFEPFVLFTKLQIIKHLRLSYECTANALKNAEGKQKALCLQRVSHTPQEKWVKHTQHKLSSNNTSLIAVHFRDLVRLHSHQLRTVPEFTWTVPQTPLFKRTRVRFAPEFGRQRSHHPNEPNFVNRTGRAPKVLMWKHPKWMKTSCKVLNTERAPCIKWLGLIHETQAELFFV